MSRSTKLLAAGFGVFATLGTGVLAARDAGYYGYGKAATAAEITGWDIDVRPDGVGLPPGSGSVLDGEALFEEKCAVCHGVFGEGEGRWPVLAGGFGTLTDERPEKTVGSYWPYASTLWDYIHRAMPFFNPQSLTNDEVYALTAYVLYLNEIVDEDFALDQDNLATIEMPNKDGFFRDNRPDSDNIACLENCRDPESIRITWDSTELGVTPTEHFKETEEDVVQAPAPLADAGREVYMGGCIACHGTGVAGAPKTGDKSAWLERIPQGMEAMVKHAIDGYRGKSGYMPPKGGNTRLNEEDVANAVLFMIEQSKTKDTQL